MLMDIADAVPACYIQIDQFGRLAMVRRTRPEISHASFDRRAVAHVAVLGDAWVRSHYHRSAVDHIVIHQHRLSREVLIQIAVRH